MSLEWEHGLLLWTTAGLQSQKAEGLCSPSPRQA